MASERVGVAVVFRRAGAAFRERMAGGLDAGRLKVMGAIDACRTVALGGHMYRCDGCGRDHPLYNSCRRRQVRTHLIAIEGAMPKRLAAPRRDIPSSTAVTTRRRRSSERGRVMQAGVNAG